MSRLRHMGSLVVPYELMWDLVPWPGIELCPWHWEHRDLAAAWANPFVRVLKVKRSKKGRFRQNVSVGGIFSLEL